MGMTAIAEAPANVARTSFVGNHAAFVAAVARIGGAEVLSRRTSITLEYIQTILDQGIALDPDVCPEIERATRTVCEELRADLIWHRDGADEVIGYSCAIEHPRETMLAALYRKFEDGPLVDGQWDPLSYRAGLMHGVSSDHAEHLLEETYANVTDWTSIETLDSLQADVDQHRSDASLHVCFGMTYDFDEDTQKQLFAEAGVDLVKEWSEANWDQSKTEALWARAQAVRLLHPEKSTIASASFAAGVAQVADRHETIQYLHQFHSIGAGQEWDAESFDKLTQHAQALALEEALTAEHDQTASWSDVLLGYSFGVRSMANAKRTERMAQAAANLLDDLLPGIKAIHQYQWVALDSPNAESLDHAPRQLAVFLMSMQEIVHLLVNLRDNMLFRQRELEDPA